MADFKKYLKSFEKARLSDMVCRYCWSKTKSATGVDAICNFCEQYVSTSSSLRNAAAEPIFFKLQEAMKSDPASADLGALDGLLKVNSDPRVFYVSGIFHKRISDSLYRSRDYNIPGFMEANSEKIGSSLAHAAKSKEMFYKAIAAAGDREIATGDDAEELLFIKFMSRIGLGRIADASKVLSQLRVIAKRKKVLDYAEMVLSVESGAADADAKLDALLSGDEVNALYYLAKHLARGKKLGEALSVLDALGKRATLPMALQLENTIKDVQEASRV